MAEPQSILLPPINHTWVPRIDRHYRLQWEEAQNAFVLLYPEGMVKLNESAGEILSLCDGTNTIDRIIGKLADKFPQADVCDIKQDVADFFADAFQQRWLHHD